MKKTFPETFRNSMDWIKNYGLPTFSILWPIVAMVVFQVNPLSTYFDIRDKREQVRFHNQMGQALLKSGSYAKAKEEYARALVLYPTNYEGLNGRYLAELFLEFDSATWDPSTGINISRHLDNLGISKRPGYQEIVCKYLGDLASNIGNRQMAQIQYDKAIELDSGYLDALFANGWLNYTAKPNLEKMIECFRKMTLRDSFDYRGFHGYGYALYMQALDSLSRKKNPGMIQEAAEQSISAQSLSINKLNVLADFGEIARSINPSLSIDFHRATKELLTDPVKSLLQESSRPLQVCLLAGESKCLSLVNPQQKLAWIQYQLALDYEALHLLGPDSNRAQLDSSETILKQAQALDADSLVYPIYRDQRKILALFLPSSTPRVP